MHKTKSNTTSSEYEKTVQRLYDKKGIVNWNLIPKCSPNYQLSVFKSHHNVSDEILLKVFTEIDECEFELVVHALKSVKITSENTYSTDIFDATVLKSATYDMMFSKVKPMSIVNYPLTTPNYVAQLLYDHGKDKSIELIKQYVATWCDNKMKMNNLFTRIRLLDFNRVVRQITKFFTNDDFEKCAGDIDIKLCKFICGKEVEYEGRKIKRKSQFTCNCKDIDGNKKVFRFRVKNHKLILSKSVEEIQEILF